MLKWQGRVLDIKSDDPSGCEKKIPTRIGRKEGYYKSELLITIFDGI